MDDYVLIIIAINNYNHITNCLLGNNHERFKGGRKIDKKKI